MPDGLMMFTIFRRPRDRPNDRYVVRAFVILPGEAVPTDIVYSARTLAEARLLVPETADTYIPRSAEDDITVVETWL